MPVRLLMILAGSLLAGSVLGEASDSAKNPTEGFVRLTPEQARWQDVPGGYGAQSATIAGDPSTAGLYVQRVRFPPHVMTRPHWHLTDRYVTVLKGTWYAGTGRTFDPSKAIPMKPGSYMFHPAGGVHWDGSNSDEEVIVQIFGLGPLETRQADANQPAWIRLKDASATHAPAGR